MSNDHHNKTMQKVGNPFPNHNVNICKTKWGQNDWQTAIKTIVTSFGSKDTGLTIFICNDVQLNINILMFIYSCSWISKHIVYVPKLLNCAFHNKTKGISFFVKCTSNQKSLNIFDNGCLCVIYYSLS